MWVCVRFPQSPTIPASATVAQAQDTSPPAALPYPKATVVRQIGHFAPAVMQRIDRCLKVSLGLT
jgi:hypothetical protein